MLVLIEGNVNLSKWLELISHISMSAQRKKCFMQMAEGLTKSQTQSWVTYHLHK